MMRAGDHVEYGIRALAPDLGHDRCAQGFERQQIREMTERPDEKNDRRSRRASRKA